MDISTYKTETIVINNPSEKLLGLMKQMREHKQMIREKIRKTSPMFTLAM